MHDSEVHSLIMDRLNEIEDDDMRQFLNQVLRHEREIISDPRGEYRDKYQSLVDELVKGDSMNVDSESNE